MRIKDLFEKWGLVGLKVKTPILEMEWEPSDPDKDAAWDLYVELLTRITTQRLPHEHGTEEAALESVHKIFELTRTTLKEHGRRQRISRKSPSLYSIRSSGPLQQSGTASVRKEPLTMRISVLSSAKN